MLLICSEVRRRDIDRVQQAGQGRDYKRAEDDAETTESRQQADSQPLASGVCQPIGRAPQMREKRGDREQVIGRKKPVESGDMKACRSEPKIGVEREHDPPVEYGGDMIEQKRRQVQTGDGLKPSHDARSSAPAANDERDTTQHLDYDQREKDRLHDRVAIDGADRGHERDMVGLTLQAHQVISHVQDGKRQQHQAGRSMRDAKR